MPLNGLFAEKIKLTFFNNWISCKDKFRLKNKVFIMKKIFLYVLIFTCIPIHSNLIFGLTPDEELIISILKKDVKEVRDALDAKADPNYCDSITKLTPLNALIIATQGNDEFFFGSKENVRWYRLFASCFYNEIFEQVYENAKYSSKLDVIIYSPYIPYLKRYFEWNRYLKNELIEFNDSIEDSVVYKGFCNFNVTNNCVVYDENQRDRLVPKLDGYKDPNNETIALEIAYLLFEKGLKINKPNRFDSPFFNSQAICAQAFGSPKSLAILIENKGFSE